VESVAVKLFNLYKCGSCIDEHTADQLIIYMAFAKKIGRTGLKSGKINGAVHYRVCHLSEKEETDLSTIIAQKAVERVAKVKAAIFESAPTNQEMEDLFN
jgi:RNA 3'-terminal phosphate cyclase